MDALEKELARLKEIEQKVEGLVEVHRLSKKLHQAEAEGKALRAALDSLTANQPTG